ncbi:AI-2E family transporter [Pontibacter sp. BAB1700]|uniref:AI-2E family transporter n=1 Tax=Pontibacter sp. BAB1700 TaxID=1144253 RepID=UPI002101D2BE|nr:AI-2E family transporter [Pontibacter sp. BAB1700]
MVLIAYLLISQGYFFLLVFSGILLAVLFSGMAEWIVQKTGMKRWVALLLSVLLFFGLIIGAFWLLAPTIAEQVGEMRETLPKSIEQLRNWLGERGWGERVAEKLPENFEGALSKQENLFSQVTGAFYTTLGFLADLVIVVITALFLAASPTLYTHGLVKLFPVHKRTRILEVLDKCYSTLRGWRGGYAAGYVYDWYQYRHWL